MKYQIYFLLFFLNSLFCTYPSFEDAHAIIEQSNQKIQLLNERLSWFLSYLGKRDEENKALLEEIGEWQRHQNHLQELQKTLPELQTTLKKLIEVTALSASLAAGDHVYQTAVYAGVLKEITNWYIPFLQSILFPNDWETIYEESSQQEVN